MKGLGWAAELFLSIMHHMPLLLNWIFGGNSHLKFQEVILSWGLSKKLGLWPGVGSTYSAPPYIEL